MLTGIVANLQQQQKRSFLCQRVLCWCASSKAAPAALTSTSRSGAVPSFGPRPFGGPVRDAYALRFFLTEVVALMGGVPPLLAAAPRVMRRVAGAGAAAASEGGGVLGWRLRLPGVVRLLLGDEAAAALAEAVVVGCCLVLGVWVWRNAKVSKGLAMRGGGTLVSDYSIFLAIYPLFS